MILPLGPQNIFIFNQGAAHRKFVMALPVVVTAALCDTLLILISVSGVSLVVIAIPQLQVILYSLGFIFLMYIGWTIWHSDAGDSDQKQAVPVKKQILFALSISLLNPHAILDTVGVIGINAVQYAERTELIAFALACILVSWIAFTLLAIIGRVVKTIDKAGKGLKIINKISAVSMWGIAGFILIEVFRML
ncbi:LysE/ArgO family amino acid transporter [Jeotgalibacillus sp. R-1-5s-1]|uniref:LysE/ArgO family amino acid transporter n=1 Tax=Jeotgalibacillus sp. R-1-5s-1 TaxID=2555897 RepID=UPI00352A8312